MVMKPWYPTVLEGMINQRIIYPHLIINDEKTEVINKRYNIIEEFLHVTRTYSMKIIYEIENCTHENSEKDRKINKMKKILSRMNRNNSRIIAED